MTPLARLRAGRELPHAPTAFLWPPSNGRPSRRQHPLARSGLRTGEHFLAEALGEPLRLRSQRLDTLGEHG